MIDLNKLYSIVPDEHENVRRLHAACEQAQRQGVTELVLTQRPPQDGAAHLDTDERGVAQLQAAWPALKFHRTYEWPLAADLPQRLRRSPLGPTINRSRYLLLSLPSLALPQHYLEIIRELFWDGYTPIIARPECCRVLRRQPGLIAELLQAGCLLQLEALSLLGGYTPEIARFTRRLLELGQAHFLTTRAAVRQDVSLSAACATASRLIGRQAARALVLDNPRAVLTNAALSAASIPVRSALTRSATFGSLAAPLRQEEG